MESIVQKMSTLQIARYLQTTIESSSSILNIELLSHGKLLRDQLEKHWDCSKNTLVQTESKHFMEQQQEQNNFKNLNTRLQFLHTKLFRENIKLIKSLNEENIELPAIKIKRTVKNSDDFKSNFFNLKSDDVTGSKQLITHHFLHESYGLAKLYNLQRERKIWWMRISADPSRYFLEAFDFTNDVETNTTKSNAQSIDIKSRLAFGNLCVENITLVPLKDVELENKTDFEIFNKRTNQKHYPAVIRSVIDLDVATCALILDGASNTKREGTLFLNRNLAPYQCQVVMEHDAVPNQDDLKDLCKHISNVIKRVGLRIYKNTNENTENEYSINIEEADQIGIPYTLFLNRDSLRTGLMKLRSRDTTLKETVHITDIPDYLLSIFRVHK